MKVTFFLGGLFGGGAERVVCNLANYLSKKGNSVDIVTIGDSEDYGLDLGIRRITLLYHKERTISLFNSVIRLFRLIKYLTNNKRDAIIVLLPVSTILILKIRFLIRGKVIASERSYPSIYPIKQQQQLKRLAKRADGWIFQTENSQNWYSNSIGNSLKTIIPNPINSTFVDASFEGKRGNVIITAGRLSNEKNHSMLLKAFSLVNKKHPDYKLIIYGEGPLRDSLEREAIELGIADNVRFPGFARWNELSKDAALFVFSSNLEGMPNALMEAMAMGMPCVSTDCDGGGAKYLIDDGVNGLLVGKDNPSEMADAINRIIDDKELAYRLGKEANKICERLEPQKIYEKWEKFIELVIKTDNNEQ